LEALCFARRMLCWPLFGKWGSIVARDPWASEDRRAWIWQVVGEENACTGTHERTAPKGEQMDAKMDAIDAINT
jgi:hypothetical protein